MKIKRLEVRNFRLLKDVSILLEDRTTLIVGRNNSGKTSITELFRRLLADKPLSFRLEDFSLGCHDEFWAALERHRQQEPVGEIRQALPAIIVKLTIAYDQASPDLGPLGDCIIDLDPACTEAQIEVAYHPIDDSVRRLFAGFEAGGAAPEQGKVPFFRALAERLQSAYVTTAEAVDPNDRANRKPIELKTLTTLVQGGFINAQRGLDDDTFRERDVLGKIVEVLFQSALADSADLTTRTTAEELTLAVEQVQKDLHEKFNKRLTTLLPTFDLFGYPGLTDPGLITETTFDVQKLLSNHTKVRYAGMNGFTLPETYNGLGTRNLIYILLQLLRFFREFQGRPSAAGVHLIFIEEPEAHLHPQMQEVFINRIEDIVGVFAEKLNAGQPWSVQFVITTHSPHMANAARFECMRYFLSAIDESNGKLRRTRIKDLREGMGGAAVADREFLHQYLTLTRCDLFFADKAILIEGTAERLLLPRMIEKVDAESPTKPQLRSQYLTVMEVGGAYAHRFFDLLNFLELRALVITDLDSVAKGTNSKYQTSLVATGERTSNGCIKQWFGNDVSPIDLIAKRDETKVKGRLRIAYQVPEEENGPCGRSFEDAFILANPELFPLDESDRAKLAFDLAADQKKSAFALEHALDKTGWKPPRYIAEGLRWLAQPDPVPPAEVAQSDPMPPATMDAEAAEAARMEVLPLA